MKTIVADPKFVAYCGLYCGACRGHLRGACPGCQGNAKASWCKVRTCNMERRHASCAECADFPDVKECRKFDNVFSRVIGFVLRSDRAACIAQIRDAGLQRHAERMAALGRQSLRPGSRSKAP